MTNEIKLTFEPDNLQQELSTLARSQQLAYSCACCERLLPNYEVFSLQQNWGNSELLRSTLDLLWNSILIDGFEITNIKRLITECEAVIPDTEAFDSILTSAALDAGNAIVETLEACINDSLKGAVAVASLARDTVDMYIQAIEDYDYSDPRFEEKIVRHPLMVLELSRQRQDLQLLHLSPVVDEGIIGLLRD